MYYTSLYITIRYITIHYAYCLVNSSRKRFR